MGLVLFIALLLRPATDQLPDPPLLGQRYPTRRWALSTWGKRVAGAVLVSAPKKGMTPDEVHRLLGEPPMRCHGEELWEMYTGYGISVSYALSSEEYNPKVTYIRHHFSDD